MVKSGRTHLMDATPVTLGQEFGGYATQIAKGSERLRKVLPELEELPLGGTAVGTGINAPEGFAAAVIELLAERTGLPFRRSRRPLRGASGEGRHCDGFGSASRPWPSRCSRSPTTCAGSARARPRDLAEIRIPDLQPGSSIMPGKVNPVIPEMVMQVAAQVVGNDATVTWARRQRQLRTQRDDAGPGSQPAPVDRIAGRGSLAVCCQRCVAGITANEDRATSWSSGT